MSQIALNRRLLAAAVKAQGADEAAVLSKALDLGLRALSRPQPGATATLVGAIRPAPQERVQPNAKTRAVLDTHQRDARRGYARFSTVEELLKDAGIKGYA